MPNSDVLVDSSFLFAVNNAKDKHNQLAKFFFEKNRLHRLVPDVVLPEVTYMLGTNIGQNAILRFLDVLITPQITLQSLTSPDVTRAREIMASYSDARLDFVDCCIMALSERLEVTRICTFDRRDFGIFRPRHCDYLELLP